MPYVTKITLHFITDDHPLSLDVSSEGATIAASVIDTFHKVSKTRKISQRKLKRLRAKYDYLPEANIEESSEATLREQPSSDSMPE